MSIEGQCHFFTIYFPGFVCFVLYKAKISGERLQDHWSSGFIFAQNIDCVYQYMQCMFSAKIIKNITIFHFTAIKMVI